MSIEDHPDYPEELKRLHYTQNYIDRMLGNTEHHQDRKNIHRALKELDSLDSSQSYINILVNAKFMDMLIRDEDRLRAIREKPYFCRIDFQPWGADAPDRLYIGRISLFRKDNQQPVIIDWRAPIATLYYEGRLGEATYESETEIVAGTLHLKRQYEIESGKLRDFRDVDVTSRDELLQASLQRNPDHRLNEIVSTIQAEQNRVIRADLNFPLVVQGVAGSGKTTIALHRIAYYLYHRADRFKPEQMMILAPNRLFLGYVAGVLPELGVLDVYQTTFPDFFREEVGKKMKLTDPDQKLLDWISGNSDDKTRALERWSARLKGSMEFKNILDRYVEEVVEKLAPEEDFVLGKKYRIRTREEIRDWIRRETAWLPVYRRLEKVRQRLRKELKSKTEEVLQEAEQFYDEKIDRAFLRIQDPEKRRQQVVHWMDRKEITLNKIQKSARALLPRYMKQFEKKDVFAHYRELFDDESRFRELSSPLPADGISFLCRSTRRELEQKRISMEDTPALLYLKHRLFGIPNRRKLKHVVIDEAQDFSLFQIFALKEAIGTSIFTILGDLAQGIHDHRGIRDWQEVLDQVFPEDHAQFQTLEQSYRTTVEIMELANQLIPLMNRSGILPARPVVRHGETPRVGLFRELGDLTAAIRSEVKRGRERDCRSAALIGRSPQECQTLLNTLAQKTDLSVRLLSGEDPFGEADLVIVPAHVAKGLEFDQVILVNWNEAYSEDELDLKLFYVAMTRPLHRLSILAREDRFPLLKKIDPRFYHLVDDPE
ncbi:RNA polymerase recycling motor HelD [Kroppenstedtia eburnea]|uniref:RNA polymerase recycling motor HelD n=1 Tax=Kroppenstedtia eburnea TaxID=714067 RepID=UPI003626339B